jgi:hypothetical protein
MNQVIHGSLDYCENMSQKCATNCLIDKRTSRIAEANWSKVFKILQQFNLHSSKDDEKKR